MTWMWRHADVAGVSNNTFLVLLAVESELSRTGGSHWSLDCSFLLRSCPVCVQGVTVCALTLCSSDTTLLVATALRLISRVPVASDSISLVPLSKHVKNCTCTQASGAFPSLAIYSSSLAIIATTTISAAQRRSQGSVGRGESQSRAAVSGSFR